MPAAAYSRIVQKVIRRDWHRISNFHKSWVPSQLCESRIWGCASCSHSLQSQSWVLNSSLWWKHSVVGPSNVCGLHIRPAARASVDDSIVALCQRYVNLIISVACLDYIMFQSVLQGTFRSKGAWHFIIIS